MPQVRKYAKKGEGEEHQGSGKVCNIKGCTLPAVRSLSREENESYLRELQLFTRIDCPAWDKLVDYYKESISSLINRIIEGMSVDVLEEWEYNRVVHECTEKDVHQIHSSANFPGKDALLKQVEEKMYNHRK